jgi:hypothetical protein
LLKDRSQLFHCINVASERKNAEGIAKVLEEQAERMTDRDTDKLVGWILDNTKANWEAMQLMQGRHPKWLLRGCLAHGLPTLVKNFSTHQKGALGGKPMRTRGAWNGQTMCER